MSAAVSRAAIFPSVLFRYYCAGCVGANGYVVEFFGVCLNSYCNFWGCAGGFGDDGGFWK